MHKHALTLTHECINETAMDEGEREDENESKRACVCVCKCVCVCVREREREADESGRLFEEEKNS